MPIAAVEVASTVTCESPTGEVVPNMEGVVLPETAPAYCAKSVEEMRWRGLSVSKLELFEEACTSKKTS